MTMAELLTPLSAAEAITRMRIALEEGDRKAVWCLYTMEGDMMPDWDQEDDDVWEQWDALLQQAQNMLNI